MLLKRIYILMLHAAIYDTPAHISTILFILSCFSWSFSSWFYYFQRAMPQLLSLSLIFLVPGDCRAFHILRFWDILPHSLSDISRRIGRFNSSVEGTIFEYYPDISRWPSSLIRRVHCRASPWSEFDHSDRFSLDRLPRYIVISLYDILAWKHFILPFISFVSRDSLPALSRYRFTIIHYRIGKYIDFSLSYTMQKASKMCQCSIAYLIFTACYSRYSVSIAEDKDIYFL